MSQPPKSSREMPGPLPRHDKQREMEEAVVQDAAEIGEEDRDSEHGDGGTIGLPVKPSDLPKDD